MLFFKLNSLGSIINPYFCGCNDLFSRLKDILFDSSQKSLLKLKNFFERLILSVVIKQFIITTNGTAIFVTTILNGRLNSFSLSVLNQRLIS